MSSFHSRGVWSCLTLMQLTNLVAVAAADVTKYAAADERMANDTEPSLQPNWCPLQGDEHCYKLVAI